MPRGWLLALMGILTSIPAWAGVRFEPPLRDPLYFNEVLALGENVQRPVRFPRLGRYYAELILEPATVGGDVVLSAPTEIGVRCTFRRDERVVGVREARVPLQPGERGKTLFFFDVPGDLPHRADLSVQTSIDAPAELATSGGFRLQIRRKLDFAPLPPWR